MFNIHIGNNQFDIYPLLDANEVIIKLHDVMKLLCNSRKYKTFIANIEKFSKPDEKSVSGHGSVDVYTLTILKSPKHLKPNEIATLFKEMFDKKKKRKTMGFRDFGGFRGGY